MTKKNLLHDKKILLIGRFDTPTFRLEEYLKKNSSCTILRTSLQVHHLLSMIKIEKWRADKRVLLHKTKNLFNKYSSITIIGVLQFLATYISLAAYLLHFFLQNRNYEIIIAVGPFNSYLSTFYKYIKRSSKIVYYVEDKISKEQNDLLGKLTYLCASIAQRKSDAVWVMSKKLLAEMSDSSGRFAFVPIPMVRYKNNNMKRKQIRKIVYVGSICKQQGYDMVYKTYQKIKKDFPFLQLVVAGSGDLDDEYKIRYKKDRMGNSVVYKGFLENQNKILETISGADIGVALYNPRLYKNLAYGQSSKTTNYLSCGLPVVITGSMDNMPSLAKYINEYKTGFVTDYDEEKIYQCLKLLVSDRRLYNEMRNNTRKMTKIFDSKTIYTNAFKAIC